MMALFKCLATEQNEKEEEEEDVNCHGGILSRNKLYRTKL